MFRKGWYVLRLNERSQRIYFMRTLVGLCVMSVSFLILYWVIMTPLYQSAILKEQAIKRLLQEVIHSHQDVSSLATVRQHQIKLKKWLNTWNMPEQIILSRSMLLENIVQQGSRLGLMVEQLTPGKEKGTSFLTRLPIHLLLLGSYDALMMFLNSLSKEQPLTVFREVNIQSSTSTLSHRLSMTLDVDIYYTKTL